MANEIQMVTHLQVQNAGADISYKPTGFALTQTGRGVFQATLTVTTTEAAVSFSGITTAGFVLLRNLDSTNYVEWGPEDTGAMVKVGRMKPGDPPAIFRLAPGTVLRMQANTASCKVVVIVVEE